MSNENQLTHDASRGSQAQHLIESPLLGEAFAVLSDTYLAAWRGTHIDDTAGREKLFVAVNLVDKVKEHLTLVLQNGTLAAAELRDIGLKREARERRNRA